jgi:hypothetical protein
MEDMLNPAIKNESLHGIKGESIYIIVNLAYLKTSQFNVQCYLIAKFINILKYLLKLNFNQIYSIMINR